MANFEVPFSNTGPRRSPTADEKANGFPCGAADQTLFNGMFHRLEAELGNLISFAGLTPTDADFTQVRKAVEALISAATGGGATADYVLLSQVMSRMPLFPEVQSTDGRINLTAPATGTVRVPGGVNILHRGLNLVTTVQTDFATVVSRTYHVRWNPTDGLSLKWLGDAGYNPGGLAEDNVAFDSTFDDMLIARVVTNSSNIATFTLLANKDRVFYTDTAVGTDSVVEVSDNLYRKDLQFNFNMGRAPKMVVPQGVIGNGGTLSPGVVQTANRMSNILTNRYGTAFRVETDFNGAVTAPFYDARLAAYA